MRHKSITQKQLKSRLQYNRSTGIFVWLPLSGESREIHRWNTRYAGKEAGTVHKDYGNLFYRRIRLMGKAYYAHCLAWLYMKGGFPPQEIDHRDGDGLNNSWGNIRLSDPVRNQGNQKLAKNNTTGFKGVSLDKSSGRYRARIQSQGKFRCLGFFNDPKSAHKAYVKAAKEHFGDFARSA